MTAHIAERLRYLGDDVAMCTNPLSDYFAMGGHINQDFCESLVRRKGAGHPNWSAPSTDMPLLTRPKATLQ